MYELFIESHFSAAHRLANYPGNCARWHGHNWTVIVFIQAQDLDDLGMGVDFREVKAQLSALLSRLDHSDLTQFPGFERANPTCEVIARYLYRELSSQLNSHRLRVARVRVCETPLAGVTYSE